MHINKLVSAAALAAGLALSGFSAAHADVLTFEGNICNGGAACTNYAPIDQSYGDTALVNVTTIYDVVNAPAQAMEYWADFYSGMNDVAFGSGGNAGLNIDPIAGYKVTLNGFDIGSWPNVDRYSSWRVFDGFGNLLGSSGIDPILISGASPTHVGSFYSTNGIHIEFGPDSYDVGIDNVDFTVSAIRGGAVPEPATWAMLIVGMGGVGAMMRRRRGTLAAA